MKGTMDNDIGGLWLGVMKGLFKEVAFRGEIRRVKESHPAKSEEET